MKAAESEESSSEEEVSKTTLVNGDLKKAKPGVQNKLASKESSDDSSSEEEQPNKSIKVVPKNAQTPALKSVQSKKNSVNQKKESSSEDSSSEEEKSPTKQQPSKAVATSTPLIQKKQESSSEVSIIALQIPLVRLFRTTERCVEYLVRGFHFFGKNWKSWNVREYKSGNGIHVKNLKNFD